MIKKITLSAILFAFSLLCFAQNGAWGGSINGETHQLLMSGGAFAYTIYSATDGDFKSTLGGLVKQEDEDHVFLIEFASSDTSLIGTAQEWSLAVEGSKMTFTPFGKKLALESWEDESASELQGAWLFSGRERNGELTRRSTDLPRKTMKILSGNHFQWIAYHVTDRKFMGSGGGKYTAKDGVYTEVIEFFSRDKSRIGAELPFQFERKEDDWHHKGKSSKGEPMYEIWSLRKH